MNVLISSPFWLSWKRNHRSSDAPAISKPKHATTMNESEKNFLETSGTVKPPKLIPLTQGKFALVDEEDFERVSQYNWHYAVKRKGSHIGCAKKLFRRRKLNKCWMIRMHRFIINAPEGVQVDHIDGNSLNNQKSNLRLCNTSQNNANQRLSSKNTSGFKGVTWHKLSGKWRAQIKFQQQTIYLGLFDNKEDASKRYDQEAVTLFGEFARTNAMIKTMAMPKVPALLK